MNRFLFVATFVVVSSMSSAQELHLTVEEMFSLIEQNNTSLIISQTAIEASQKELEGASRQRLPDIATTLAGNYNGNILMMNRDWTAIHGYTSPRWGNNFSLEVSQTIYAGGALTAGMRLAEVQKEMLIETKNLTREQLRFIALGQYLDLFTLANRQRVYESNIALTEQLLDNITAKYNEGMALKNDITRYELLLADLRLDLRRVTDLRDVKNRELCVALGIEQTTIVPDAGVIEQTFAPDADVRAGEQGWQAEALLSSPEIKMASLNTALAEQNVRLARSEYLPRLNIFAADSFTGPITFEVPIVNQNLNAWYVGIGLSWDVSALYKSSKKVRKTRLLLKQSREKETLAAENVGNSIYASYTAYQQAFAALDTQTKSVTLAEENYHVVSDRYLNQLSLITDMLDASNILLNAQLMEVDARINVVYSYYQMKYLSGTL